MRLTDDGAAVLAWSPAKLNLRLAIRGRRPDGFHELETLMIKVSIFDSLRFSPRNDDAIVLHVQSAAPTGHAIPRDRANLVVRAAEMLRTETGIQQGVDIFLHKQIPAEAGLAGGSGNAAATLAGLARLWRLPSTAEELARLASTLGSDVPFFLSPATAAIARGRGEQIEPVAVGGPLQFVIAKPPFGLATADVYRAFAVSGTPSVAQSEPLVAALRSGRLSQAGRLLHNDLGDAAESLRPELASLRERLDQECTFGGLMTGSGSACFGLCATKREARVVAGRLQTARLGQIWAASSA